MLRTAVLFLLAARTYASPHMCHCPNGAVGLQCPSPIQLNCPPPQCPPQLPCHTFPTIAPLGSSGNSLFTLPTIAPLGQPFSATTALPLPVAPPTNGQESLLPIANQGQAFAPAAATPPPLFGSPPPPPPPPPVVVQPIAPQTPAPTVFVDSTTTTATTLPSAQYVEADNPEAVPNADEAPIISTEDKYGLYENEPNNGFRQPVRRALASNTQGEVLSEKCNDERLKKIIEQNVDSNASSSKRKIQKAATEEIGGLFDVICSSHDFSYLANTQLFCEAGNDDITCFAFLHSLIQ